MPLATLPEPTETTAVLAAPNELLELLAEAYQVSYRYNQKEVCTLALLYAIAQNPDLAACEALISAGYKVGKLKTHLLKALKAKGDAATPFTGELAYSNAVAGLLALTELQYGTIQISSRTLLVNLIKYNNTAAARLLKQQGITVKGYNKLIYEPIKK
jgi:ATP-dependent Clp protease ATP-binding subunit ClpA